VLGNDGVIVVKPLLPRPDTLKKRAEEVAALEASEPTTQEERVARGKRRDELRSLDVELLDDKVLYTLPVGRIASIINFEELMLRRVDKLLADGDIRTAYELLRLVESTAPGWEKSSPRFEALLLREAEVQVGESNYYAALALLDELAKRNIENAQLPQALAAIIDPAIQAAIAENDFSQAHHLISRLAQHFPSHDTVRKWTEQLRQRSNSLLNQAAELANQRQFSEAAELAREADQIWATTGNARATYSQILARHQVIRVAVSSIADSNTVSPVPLESELRHRELTSVPLLEPSAADEMTWFHSDYFEKWDPAELGRRVVISLRTTRPYWQSQPVLSANQIADALSDRLNPNLPSHNPRLASFVSRFSVRSPTEFQVEFDRVPLNIEALFRFPVIGIPEAERTDPTAVGTQEMAAAICAKM